jgi:hypothetical protein
LYEEPAENLPNNIEFSTSGLFLNSQPYKERSEDGESTRELIKVASKERSFFYNPDSHEQTAKFTFINETPVV